jgi:hypothetical protein
MQVKRRNNESSEALIKRFTRKVKKLKIIEEIFSSLGRVRKAKAKRAKRKR